MVRFMTYNILDGGFGREDYILEIIQAVAPDIVLLEEVLDFSVIEAFGDSLGMNSFFSPGNSKRKLALLSRWPIAFSESYHPLPLKSSLLITAVEYAPDSYLHIFGVHLHAQFSWASELLRVWEANIILQKIRRMNFSPALIAGDFNAVGPHDRVVIDSLYWRSKVMLRLQGGRVFRTAVGKFLRAGFTDCYRFLHPSEDGFTLPPPNPIVRFDYIFADDKLVGKLKRCEVVTGSNLLPLASDHNPLVAEFSL